MNATVTPGHTHARDIDAAMGDLESDLAAACPQVQFAFGVRGNALVLELIYLRTELRGQGAGRKALERLCAWADEHAIELRLQLSDAWGSDPRRLASWYARAGFTPVPQPSSDFRAPWMRRLPPFSC